MGTKLLLKKQPYDVFIIMGDSNASGRGTNSQTFTQSGVFDSLLFANDYTYKRMADPTDSTTNQVDTVSQEPVAPPSGSAWPIVATGLSALGRRTIFIPCALGGSAIGNWLPSSNHEDRTTLYGSMVYRAKQVQSSSHILRGVLCWVGTNDTMTQSQFYSALTAIAANIYADLSIPLIPQSLQICGGTVDTEPETLAIKQAWADGNANLKTGADISDMLYDENTYNGTTYYVHICSDEKLAILGSRWVTAIKNIFSW
jgi:hypothetical protein